MAVLSSFWNKPKAGLGSMPNESTSHLPTYAAPVPLHQFPPTYGESSSHATSQDPSKEYPTHLAGVNIESQPQTKRKRSTCKKVCEGLGGLIVLIVLLVICVYAYKGFHAGSAAAATDKSAVGAQTKTQHAGSWPGTMTVTTNGLTFLMKPTDVA